MVNESSERFIKRGSTSSVHLTREFVFDRPFTDKVLTVGYVLNRRIGMRDK